MKRRQTSGQNRNYRSSMSSFKPMLSATCDDINTVKYPVYASTKLDGIRCILKDGVAVSRNLKPIPNKYIQAKLGALDKRLNLDGELIVGEPFGKGVWARTQSGVMSEDGEPDFTYWIFDIPDRPELCFETRFHDLDLLNRMTYPMLQRAHIKILPHEAIHNAELLKNFEEVAVAQGFEGIMIRDPGGRYKFGRSTVKEGGLMKVKRWYDMEGEIIGWKEQMENTNEQTRDELGRAKRSTHKDGKVGKGTLGAWILKIGEHEVDCGSGMNDAIRQDAWNNIESFKGKLVKFKYTEISEDGIPRFPIFLGFRDPRDLS
jgi:DNA ligase-1